MAEKKSSPAMELVLEQLRENPDLEYKDLQETASQRGFVIYPIMYGRAKALLGLVPTAPRGSRKKPRGKGKTLRGDRARAASGSPIESLEAMLGELKDVALERDRLRRALEQIADILDDVL